MSKILFIAPKYSSQSPLRLDLGYWNFYIPMMELGHEVRFFDIGYGGNSELRDEINKFQPDLLFMVAVGNTNVIPDEPFEVVEEETKKGSRITFNWFCDDSWRFENFSSKICEKFHYCSTPERSFIKKYEGIGYKNILYKTWHANPNFFNNSTFKSTFICHVGGMRPDRYSSIKALVDNGIEVLCTQQQVSFEDMISIYNQSRIGLNFSRNSVNNGTQMKARMFEIPMSGAMLLTENTTDLVHNFDCTNEISTFESVEELIDNVNYFRSKPALVGKIANAGFERALKDHTSHKRLDSLLQCLV